MLLFRRERSATDPFQSAIDCSEYLRHFGVSCVLLVFFFVLEFFFYLVGLIEDLSMRAAYSERIGEVALQSPEQSVASRWIYRMRITVPLGLLAYW